MLARTLEHEAEPATRSLTVCDTTTSEGPAAAATRAPIDTVRPAHLPSSSSHSPAWMPLRTSIPRVADALGNLRAHLIARAGPSKVA